MGPGLAPHVLTCVNPGFVASLYTVRSFKHIVTFLRFFFIPPMSCRPSFRMSRVVRRFWALAAALLVYWAAVHPALLNLARGGMPPNGNVLLCTAQGMKWVDTDAALNTQPEPPLSRSGGLHCPWCTFMHLWLPIPPEPLRLVTKAHARLVRVLAAPLRWLRVAPAPHLRALPGRGPPWLDAPGAQAEAHPISFIQTA